MSDQGQSVEFTLLQKAGILVFVFLCGIPALEMNGFGFGIPFTLRTAFACAAVGGAVGGALVCPRSMLAGITGGLLAGPVGLLAVYFYTQHRESVYTLELVIVQGVASLPGVGVGFFLWKSLAGSPPEGSEDGELES